MGMIELWRSEFPFVDRTEIKTLIARHLQKGMDDRKLTQADLARLIDSSPSTVQRALDRDPTFDGVPGFETIFKICRALRIPMPDAPFHDHDAFAENGVELIKQPPNEWDPNITDWQVSDENMVLAGLLPKDRVRVDARIKPRNGDIVLVQLSSPGQHNVQTALRVFKAPYVHTASLNPMEAGSHQVDVNAIIMGTVTKQWRDRVT